MYDQLLVSWDTNNGTGEISATGLPATILAFAGGVVIGQFIYNMVHKKNLLQPPNEATILES